MIQQSYIFEFLLESIRLGESPSGKAAAFEAAIRWFESILPSQCIFFPHILPMQPSIFVSLPVKDVKKSTAFYEALGFKQREEFKSDATACIAVSDAISVMLASHEQFKQISPRPIADPAKGCHALLSLSLDSREAVDDMVAKAIANGGSKAHEPEDYGFMYQHAFYDLDGHGWGLTWFKPAN